MAAWFLCYDCVKFEMLMVGKDVCALCGGSNGEVLSPERVREGIENGTYRSLLGKLPLTCLGRLRKVARVRLILSGAEIILYPADRPNGFAPPQRSYFSAASIRAPAAARGFACSSVRSWRVFM